MSPLWEGVMTEYYTSEMLLKIRTDTLKIKLHQELLWLAIASFLVVVLILGLPFFFASWAHLEHCPQCLEAADE